MKEDKRKKIREPFNWRKELRLTPGYLILIVWILFTVILVGWVFGASFATTKDIFAGDALKFPTGLHFENYVKAFTAQNIGTIMLNSLGYATVSSILLVVISAPASYVLSRFKFFANLALQRGFAAAMGVPVVMIILPLFGLVSSLNLTGTELGTRLLMVFLYIGINIPFTIIFLLTFFSTLSRSMEEAAAIDGCSPAKTFWRIMLPLAQPGIITVTIFNFINIWNEYFMSLIFASGKNVRPVAVGLYSMIDSMKYTGDWAGMFASVIIVFLPTFVLYVILSGRIIEGVTGGAVKG